MSADRCSRCRAHVTHVVTYWTGTAKNVERVCEADAKAIKKQGQRKVKVTELHHTKEMSA